MSAAGFDVSRLLFIDVSKATDKLGAIAKDKGFIGRVANAVLSPYRSTIVVKCSPMLCSTRGGCRSQTRPNVSKS
jgi:hypothetical protein